MSFFLSNMSFFLSTMSFFLSNMSFFLSQSTFFSLQTRFYCLKTHFYCNKTTFLCFIPWKIGNGPSKTGLDPKSWVPGPQKLTPKSGPDPDPGPGPDPGPQKLSDLPTRTPRFQEFRPPAKPPFFRAISHRDAEIGPVLSHLSIPEGIDRTPTTPFTPPILGGPAGPGRTPKPGSRDPKIGPRFQNIDLLIINPKVGV